MIAVYFVLVSSFSCFTYTLTVFCYPYTTRYPEPTFACHPSPIANETCEYSAGGGGKTPFRNEKIRAKNDKLREERARRMKAELEAKHKEDEQDGIHPSRRAQMHRNQQADAQ